MDQSEVYREFLVGSWTYQEEKLAGRQSQRVDSWERTRDSKMREEKVLRRGRK
jgi:hypothetical protein